MPRERGKKPICAVKPGAGSRRCSAAGGSARSSRAAGQAGRAPQAAGGAPGNREVARAQAGKPTRQRVYATGMATVRQAAVQVNPAAVQAGKTPTAAQAPGDQRGAVRLPVQPGAATRTACQQQVQQARAVRVHPCGSGAQKMVVIAEAKWQKVR